jgi:tetratricopeptide (TPR) repeat protein
MKKQGLLFLLFLFSWIPQITSRDSYDFDFDPNQFIEISPRELYNLGLEFESRNDLGNALLSYLTVIEKTRNQNDSISLRLRGLAKTKAGIIYFSHGNFTQASTLFHNSLGIFVGLGDMDGEANLLNNLGTVYYKWGDHEEALEFFHRAMHISDSLGLQQSLLLTYNNIGAVHLAMNNYEKGLELFQKSLAIHIEKGDSSVFHLLSNIGVVYQQFDDDATALSYYSRANDVARALNRPEHVTISLINIAELHLRDQQYHTAIELFREALQIAESEGFRTLLRSVYASLSRAYSASGEIRMAQEYYKRFLHENELIFNAERHKALRETQILYEVEKKNREIIILEKERENQVARLRLQATVLVIFGLLIFFTLLSVTLFSIQRRNQKNSYRHLISQNIEIVENDSKNLQKIKRLEKKLGGCEEDEELLHQETLNMLELLDEKKQLFAFSPNNEIILFEKTRLFFNELASELKISNDDPGPFSLQQSFAGPVDNPMLNEFSKKKIAKAILDIMEDEKPYLNDDFSLDKLTALVGSNKKYVSMVLNDEFGKGFNHFINEYRIREARKMLTDSRYQHYTIEAVSSFVGFKSKTSFNQAFKLFTGLTPSYYKRATRLAHFYRHKKGEMSEKATPQ